MFQYWEMTIRLKEEPPALLMRLCDELMDAWESQDHILFEIRDSTVNSTWTFRNRRSGDAETEEEKKQEYSDFIDAIYSGSMNKFFEFFFGDDYQLQKLLDGSGYCLVYTDGAGYDESRPQGSGGIEEFFGPICIPEKTYVETQILDDDHLPYRYYLTDRKGASGNPIWDFQPCEIHWPERSK